MYFHKYADAKHTQVEMTDKEGVKRILKLTSANVLEFSTNSLATILAEIESMGGADNVAKIVVGNELCTMLDWMVLNE